MAEKPKHDGPIVVLFGIFAVLLACIVFWFALHEEISSGIRWVRVAQLHVIVLFDSSFEPLLKQLKAMPANQIKLIHLWQMTQAVNGAMLIPFTALMFFMGIKALFTKEKHPFCRKLDLEKVIATHADAFPVTNPITKFNPLAANFRYLGSPVPDKLPMFAEALTPDEWVSYYSIPVDHGNIDEESARRALAQQLGGRWKGVKALPLFAQALFVAFSMKANGMRTESDLFLGEIAKCWSAQKGLVLTSEIKKTIRQKLIHPKFGRVSEKIAAQHAFVVPALLRCLQVARDNGGVLAPAQFLWLRGVNRHYWYALNNLGRSAVHMEASGGLAHYRAEKSAGKPIPNPLVDPAIDGLKRYLQENFIERFPAKEFSRSR
jgi:intracellular multiplication protein IcmP